jgi:ABC-2 type transport system ATP-binding protein
MTASTTTIPAIETVGLTKTYGSNRGIRDINLTVERGEIFGFLGPNGAGKSTTLRTLLGFLRPASGTARVLGLDIRTHQVEIHRRIGNLPSEFSLEDRMTARELLGYYANLRGSGQPSLDFAHELANRLDANLDTPMRRLSRGNKQKIGIIQALFHQPDLIILDEPTGGLDPLVQETFLTILQEARDQGQTVFFSSHILSEVEQIADRVGIIREGQLVAVENPHDLTGRAFRYVRIVFDTPPPLELVEGLRRVEGVDRIELNDATLTFTAAGPAMNSVIQLAAGHPIVTFDAERPPLEEIFLTYYGDAAG